MKSYRPNDSSKTRVAPVFNALASTGSDWVRRLLDLVGSTAQSTKWASEDLSPLKCYWQSNNPKRKEKSLQPPLSLLEWLIWNAEKPKRGMPKASASTTAARELLCARDPETIVQALDGVASGKLGREWYVLEGPSYPDAFIETPDALIIVEGKFTEAGATTTTTWMSKRHQMLRHLDGAWEIRGSRSVYGFFVVEADESTGLAVPEKWRDAAKSTNTYESLKSSLPHRQDSAERAQIGECFTGITTWQAIQTAFKLDPSLLKPRI
jgi:hypothetical protein